MVVAIFVASFGRGARSMLCVFGAPGSVVVALAPLGSVGGAGGGAATFEGAIVASVPKLASNQ